MPFFVFFKRKWNPFVLVSFVQEKKAMQLVHADVLGLAR